MEPPPPTGAHWQPPSNPYAPPPPPPPHPYRPPAPPARPGGNGRIIGIVAAVLVGLLVLCGGAVTAGLIVIQRSGVLQEAIAGPVATPSEQPVRTGPIEWLAMQRATPEQDAIWIDLVDEFTATGLGEVELRQIPSDTYPSILGGRLRAEDPPDLYYSSGGNRLRQQVADGLVRDLTDDLAEVIATMPPSVLAPYTVDGRVYGLPYHTGIVGIWYDKALFAGAGLDPEQPPRTWDDFLTAVAAIRAAGTVPVALGGEENWPLMFWYGMLVTRLSGSQAMVAAGEHRSLAQNPDFLDAAHLLAEFIAAEPFQPGHLTASYAGVNGQAELVGGGEAAMELMGFWAPGVHELGAPGGLGDQLGWFPFPEVPGGRGGGDLYGGGDGFAVASRAPETTIELLRFLFEERNYDRILADDPGLVSVRADATAPAGDPLLGQQLAVIQNAAGMQLYLDADLPPGSGGALFEAMAGLLTGALSPEQAVSQISDGWQSADDY
jgi:raffinose/stachyose/melibiose transport system substrate-binding protein